MEKKIWSTPNATVEQFMPNEYVNACWKIACHLGDTGNNSGTQDPFHDTGFNGNANNNHRQNYDGTGCGWDTNQYVQDAGNNYFKITEVNLSEDFEGTGITSLPATIYGATSDDVAYDASIWNNQGSNTIYLSDQQLQDGVRLYWTTSASWTYRGETWSTVFHHYGIVSLIDSLRVKHS